MLGVNLLHYKLLFTSNVPISGMPYLQYLGLDGR